MATTQIGSSLVEIKHLFKSYQTDAGYFPVLKGIDLTISRGEFVGVVGKSGSGKSTLINMITGIDHPTDGDIRVAGTSIQKLSEGNMAVWRGKNLGIVFQFFQLLPTLTIAENVMLPMDFANLYSSSDRRRRAMKLLEMVEIAEQADKLPSQLSGGQQQRAAIARALANDPPIIVADEPTGNLDTKTADRIFALFQELVDHGKTIVMVTHDGDLARKLSRTLIISDGSIIEEYLTHTFPALSEKLLIETTAMLKIRHFKPGETIIQKGQKVTSFYVIVKGNVDIILSPPDTYEFIVTTLKRGDYVGEIELMTGKPSVATVRAAINSNVELAELTSVMFDKLIKQSTDTRKALEQAARAHLEENITRSEKIKLRKKSRHT